MRIVQIVANSDNSLYGLDEEGNLYRLECDPEMKNIYWKLYVKAD